MKLKNDRIWSRVPLVVDDHEVERFLRFRCHHDVHRESRKAFSFDTYSDVLFKLLDFLDTASYKLTLLVENWLSDASLRVEDG